MLKSLKIDQVNAIIKAANDLNEKYPPTGTAIRGSDITVEEIAAYHTDEKPLADLLSALNKEARMELMALIWVGRGDEDDFGAAVEYARRNSDDGDVPYIAEKAPALPTYLRDGLKKVGLKGLA